MADDEQDATTLGKRARLEDLDPRDIRPAEPSENDDDDDEDVGPMPVPGAKKKRKGVSNPTFCSFRTSRNTDHCFQFCPTNACT